MRVRVRSGARDAARGGEGRHPLPGGGLLSARGRSGRGPAAERPSQPLPDQGRGWLLQRQGRQRDTGERRLALPRPAARRRPGEGRSEEHTSELQSLMRISYAVFCLKKKNNNRIQHHYNNAYVVK